MTTVAKKRQRSENWLEEDKIILKDLVKERVRVLENKNTDTNCNSMKVAAWNDLRESFNSMCKSSLRSVTQLKAQWGLLKMNAKKVKALERKSLLKTGVGPAQITNEITSEDLSSWLPYEFMVDKNEFDSDQINQITCPSTSTGPEIPPKPLIEDTHIDNIQHNDEIETVTSKEVIEELPHPLPLTSPRPKSAKLKKKIIHKTTLSPAEKVTACEMDCRKELHSLQI